ncbi:MAG: DeoR/GlpR transcriptional regulator [Rhodobacteraceae bacterium]|nr:DeoR/GlpR transcriptional regulator [Paracoccaceae bacterium]
MDLNIPDTRQSLLAERLDAGQTIVASDVAEEFGISLDTIRRDILALEAQGKARRVRGGAMPLAQPASPFHTRLHDAEPIGADLIATAVAQVGDTRTLLIDGGTTALALIPHLERLSDRLIITPSPWAAIACQECGHDVFLLGGTLSRRAGVTIGAHALQKVAEVAADVAILGACGLEAGFGLSSDEYDDSLMKQAMHAAAAQTFVVTSSDKVGRRARHQTLQLSDIDRIITDAAADQTNPLSMAGAQLISSLS